MDPSLPIPGQAEVIDAIVQAFPPLPLAHDWTSTYGEADAFMAGIVDQTWCRLPLDFILDFADAIYFVPPEHYAGFLPAWLVCAIESFNENPALADSLFIALDPHWEDGRVCKATLRRLESLSIAQRQVIGLALLHLQPRFRAANQRVRRRWVDGQDNGATKLLNRYWGEYIPDASPPSV